MPTNQLTEAELDELANTRPTLTYGNPTKPAPVEFIPAHVAFDKKVRVICIYRTTSTVARDIWNWTMTFIMIQ